MSHSTNSDTDKETGHEKPFRDNELAEAEEDAAKPAELPANESPEKQPNDTDGPPLAREPSAKPSVNDIKSVPNGGLKAWSQVLGSFFIFFNTWGIATAFGTYQTYYISGILEDSSASSISWIGSIQAFLLLLGGTFAGPIYDAGYVRHLIVVGSLLIVFGQMMLSLCTSYYQVFLAQGVCIGLGTGCLFVTGVAILSTYFSTRIAIANGLAAAGSSMGGVIYPIIFYRLQPRIGFPWATRVIGFIMLGTLLISISILKPRVLPQGRRKLVDLAALRELPYLFFTIGGFLAFTGMYTPFFYVQSYALDLEVMGPGLAFYLLAILNAASTFGRIIPNYVADMLGPLNILVPCALICGILAYCLIAADSTAGIIVITALYGFFSGTLVSLPPTVYVRLSAKKRGMIGTRMGMGFAFFALGTLIGTPISGAILDAAGFEYIWVFSATMVTCGAMFFAAARVAQGGWDLRTVV